MEQLFKVFIRTLNSYGANMAIDNSYDAEKDRDEIIALFIRACMADFKHDKEV